MDEGPRYSTGRPTPVIGATLEQRAGQSSVRRWMEGMARPAVAVPLGALLIYVLVGYLLVPVLVRHYVPLLLAEQSGARSAIGEVRFNPFLLRLEAGDFALDDSTGKRVFGFDALTLDFQLSSLIHQAWVFSELSLLRPRVDLILEPDGRLNVQRLLDALPDTGEPRAEPSTPPRVVLDEITIDGAQIRYVDARPVEPVTAQFGPLNLNMREISTIADHEGEYTLRAELPGGATAHWEGRIALQPLGSNGSLQIEGLRPGAFWDIAAGQIDLAPPEGIAAVELDYQISLVGGELRAEVQTLHVSVRDLLLRRRQIDAPMLQLSQVELSGGRFSLAERTMVVDEVRFANGNLGLRMDRSGVPDWANLLPAEPKTEPTSGSAGAGFVVELPKVAVENVALDVLDESRNVPLGVGTMIRQLAFSASLSVGDAEPKAMVSNAKLQLEALAVSGGAPGESLVSIAALRVDDASLDPGAERVSVKALSLEGVRGALRRRADGSFREVNLVTRPDSDEPLPLSHAASDWQAMIGELSVSGIDADFADEVSDPPVAFSVRGGWFALTGVNTGSADPLAVDVELPLAEGGSVAIEGNAAGDGSTADLRVRVDRLSLLPLASLIGEQTTLVLGSGVVGADVGVAYRGAGGDSPWLAVRGKLDIDALLFEEAEAGERFVSWQSLSAEGLELDIGPDRLHVRELRFVEPGAKIVINQDRSTNLDAVMRDPQTAPALSKASEPDANVADAMPAAAEPAQQYGRASEDAAVIFPLKIDRIRIDGGTLDFADFSLVLPFAARIEGFAGVARGVSSAPDGRGTLAFGGRVGEFGEAEIDGQLALFDPERFTDVQVSFRNVALSPLSPYTATFAGRTIDSGTVDLDLDYRIEDGGLAGENRVVLQDLTLGQSVESPGATDLPLDLAVALLTDSQGRIDLEVPVTGNVGDPQFSYGRLVGRALRNLIVGVVAAPFRALGSLLGGEADAGLQAIRFKSGSAELMPRERERVAQVAAALAERPQLGIAIASGTEPERDGYALRRLDVRRAHASALKFDLQAGEDPGPVSYTEPESQRALEVLLETRSGEGAVERFAAEWARQHGGVEPERVNAVLELVGGGRGQAEFYRAMYLHLVGSLPEPAAELAALARARAQNIAAEFRERGVDGARLGLATPRPLAQASPAGVLLPLELAPADQLTLSAISE